MPVFVTKQVIAEQVLYKLAGGVYDVSFPIQPQDIYKATEQKLNAMFKARHFDVTLPSGETIPESTMIATYENVAVVSANGKAKAVLPVIPISLPKNMGIYSVYDPAYPDMPYIPLQRGQRALLAVDDLLNDLFGQVGYEPKNDHVEFTQDITLFDVNAVTMELCIFDIAQYSATENLPIPADYLEQIVNELTMQFSPVVAESGQVSNWTTLGQNPVNQQ